MTSPIINAVVVTEVIRAGGGPSGYVNNLRCGLAQISDEERAVTFDFAAREIGVRRSAIGGGAFNGAGWLFFLRKIFSITKLLVKKLQLKYYLAPHFYKWRKVIRGADVVIVQGYQEPHLFRYARRWQKCVIYMPHSPSLCADEYKMMCENGGARFERHIYARMFNVEREFFRDASVIVFPSENSSTAYKVAFSSELMSACVRYVKSGVDVPRRYMDAQMSRPCQKEVVEIYFLGRYVSHKGFDLFCEAANMLDGAKLKARFFCAGAGPLSVSSPDVIDLGWREDIFEIISRADIIVVPNRIAYYDLLPLECAALGKPLVMTAVGGNLDQLNDLLDSVACEPAPGDLAYAIENAVQLLRAQSDWGRKNRVSYASNFSSLALAKRWEQLVLDCLHDLS